MVTRAELAAQYESLPPGALWKTFVIEAHSNGVNRPGFRGDSTSMREDGVHGTTAKVSSRVPGEGGAPRLRVA